MPTQNVMRANPNHTWFGKIFPTNKMIYLEDAISEKKLDRKILLTFRFSQFKFTLPASNFSASPSSSGSAMNVSLFLLFVVFERKQRKI